MERHLTHFEQQADRDQRRAEDRQRGVVRLAVDGLGDTGQAQGARVAVQQGDAVEEERRRERAQQKVFQRRFLR